MRRPICISLFAIVSFGLIGLGVGTPLGKNPVSNFLSSESLSLNGKDKSRPNAITEDWRGTWQVSVAYRDQETGLVMATDVTTAPICPGESVFPAPLPKKAACTFRAGDHGVSALCGAIQMPAPGCVVFIDALLDTHRQGENWSGTGSWRALVLGTCAHPEPEKHCPTCNRDKFGEDFVVSGTRISNQANCDSAPPSLVESFFPRPELSPILGGN